MYRIKPIPSLFSILLIFAVSCTQPHLLNDKKQRVEVAKQLEAQKKLLADNPTDFFSVFNQKMTTEEKDALEFLYAYMPLNDLLDYDGSFFVEQAKIALKSRAEMPWGRTIPEDIFCHFVLPYRSGNENLDTFRTTVYDELKLRVQGMDMKQAALEINHWCHEKVTYQSTDSRTSSPLALMQTSWGRCGEEAAFTVAAMRTVGIPARQCFTPRWAHTDDNHAWVEVWVDGSWYFLGACEPEADLNMGWFAEPARRAMLVNAQVYGNYLGNEYADLRTSKGTTLNITSNYAPVKEVFFHVSNSLGEPVSDARVSFKVFNYGELSTIQTKRSDEQGNLSMMSGLGDYFVWATDGQKFGFAKVHVETADSVQIVIAESPDLETEASFVLVPPVSLKPLEVNTLLADENKLRLQKEDEIRNAYMASFPNEEKIQTEVGDWGDDQSRIIALVQKSQGNWRAIIDFIKRGAGINKRETIDLLEVVSDKDLRDASAETLLDHLQHSTAFEEDWKKENYDDYQKYVLNPRVANEALVTYRSFFQQSFSENQKILFHADPTSLFEWTKEKIKLLDAEDFSRVVISPIGVMKGRIADLHSLNVFFVAACRTFGIPARMNYKNFVPEYFVRNEWRTVRFSASEEIVSPMGFVQIDMSGLNFTPEYGKHWTLAKYEDGNYRTIHLSGRGRQDNGDGKQELPVGEYMITTGNRLSDGTVPCLIQFFSVKEKEISVIKLKFNHVPQAEEVLGVYNGSWSVKTEQGELMEKKDLFSQKQLIFMWLDPDKEPSKHVLNEMISMRKEFESWGGKIVLFRAEKSNAEIAVELKQKLPVNCIFSEKESSEILRDIAAVNPSFSVDFMPVVTLLDSNGQVHYFSSGYKIGTAEQLLKSIKSLLSK